MATELEELRVLQIAERFSDEVWKIVGAWNQFSRDVVGKQITRASDSIGANVAEAYGRFHYGEKINLLYYARGSAYETKYWINRCRTRKLTDEVVANRLTADLVEIARQINSFVRMIKSQRTSAKTKSARESHAEYAVSSDFADDIFEGVEMEWLASTDPDLEPPLTIQRHLISLQSQVISHE